MSKISKTYEFFNEHAVFINSVDLNLDKQTNVINLQFHAVLPVAYTYNYLDRVRLILQHSDLYDRITFSPLLTSRVFVPYEIMMPIPSSEISDSDQDNFSYDEEVVAGTNPEDETDFSISFFNVFRFL
jgi:hypothetical protein